MENRGTGLTPNRLPSEWEKKPLEMTREPAQGPMETSRPVGRRDLSPTGQAGEQRDYGQMVIGARPGMQARAAQVPIAPLIDDSIDQSGALDVHEHLVDQGGLTTQQTPPGDVQVIYSGGPGPDGIMTTKPGVKGKTLAKGTI